MEAHDENEERPSRAASPPCSRPRSWPPAATRPRAALRDGDGGERDPAAADFLPCIVSDAGGFDDKSFNQLGYEGAKQAADELGVELKAVESNSENDYGPNLESLVAEGCDAIVTVGFALAAATKESATANPDIEYILIDDAADGGDDGETFDGTGRPSQHQAAALRHRPGGVPGRLRWPPTTPRPASSAPTAACRSRP